MESRAAHTHPKNAQVPPPGLKARFHLNDHTIEFHPQAHDLELHTNLLLCKSAPGEVSSTVSGGSRPSDRGGGGAVIQILR